jgi:hypothetical protein
MTLVTVLVLLGRERVGRCEKLSSDSLGDGVAGWASARNEVRFDGGFFGAGGLTGISYTYRAAQSVAFEAGLGVGLSDLQVSLMPRLVFGTDENRFTPGVGLAMGLPPHDHYVHGTPVWLTLELVGYEHRFRKGVTIFVAAGFMVGMGGGKYCDDCEAEESVSETEKGHVYPQGRFGLGYAF